MICLIGKDCLIILTYKHKNNWESGRLPQQLFNEQNGRYSLRIVGHEYSAYVTQGFIQTIMLQTKLA
jgi:hypothetical protein